jgi:hypothetical protein
MFIIVISAIAIVILMAVYSFYKNTNIFYKVTTLISLSLSVFLAYFLLEKMTILGYREQAYIAYMKSFDDLAAAFPKNIKKDELLAVASEEASLFPLSEENKNKYDAINIGSVVYYFAKNGNLREIRPGYSPWLDNK